MSSDLTHFTFELDENARRDIFEYMFRRLAAHRNTAVIYANNAKRGDSSGFESNINSWANNLLKAAWNICDLTQTGKCPKLDPDADTSIRHLGGRLPRENDMTSVLNAILLLHITETKDYSAHTRTFIRSLGEIDEPSVVATLKNPEKALDRAQKRAEEIRKEHSNRSGWRYAGMGLAAVAGGVLVGVTGGLAAPLVGAGLSTVLGFFGLGGTAAGLLATGLASSSVVCGALFGAYGAKSSSQMIGRHMRRVNDLALMPVHERHNGDDTLAVRLCVSGWLDSKEDVKAPWTIFTGEEDTFALQWEVEALEELSNALTQLIKSHAIKYVKGEIIKRTVFAALFSALSPAALLKIGQIIDNPWMNAQALAIKTGAVLADIIVDRAFGNRPLTLTGYSLGALVIFEALKHLAALPKFRGHHLVQDVFLFGLPASSNPETWNDVRSVVAGRLVNGYSKDDYVLAVLSRASNADWNVAGLQEVNVMGVENVLCEVDGHTKWRAMIGRCLEQCGVEEIKKEEVEKQMAIKEEIEKLEAQSE